MYGSTQEFWDTVYLNIYKETWCPPRSYNFIIRYKDNVQEYQETAG